MTVCNYYDDNILWTLYLIFENYLFLLFHELAKNKQMALTFSKL